MRLLAIRDAEKKIRKIYVWDPVGILTAVSTILSMILLDEFISVFDKWKYRMRECINRGEEYL
jgi:hypothetical protein